MLYGKVLHHFHNFTDIISENYKGRFKIFLWGNFLEFQVILQLVDSVLFNLFIFFKLILLEIFQLKNKRVFTFVIWLKFQIEIDIFSVYLYFAIYLINICETQNRKEKHFQIRFLKTSQVTIGDYIHESGYVTH